MIFHVYYTLKSVYDMVIMLVEFNIPTDTKYEMKLTAFQTLKYCNVYSPYVYGVLVKIYKTIITIISTTMWIE